MSGVNSVSHKNGGVIFCAHRGSSTVLKQSSRVRRMVAIDLCCRGDWVGFYGAREIWNLRLSRGRLKFMVAFGGEDDPRLP